MKRLILAGIAAIIPATSNAFTIQECALFSNEVLALLEYRHDRLLGRGSDMLPSELRDTFQSPAWGSEDVVFYNVYAATVDHDLAFLDMTESDREANRAYIALQFRTMCSEGNL